MKCDNELGVLTLAKFMLPLIRMCAIVGGYIHGCCFEFRVFCQAGDCEVGTLVPYTTWSVISCRCV